MCYKIKLLWYVLHEALTSHLLITSVIEGDSEHLTMHQTISIREWCQILSLVLSSPMAICLCRKNWTNAVRLPLDLKNRNCIISKFKSGEKLNCYYYYYYYCLIYHCKAKSTTKNRRWTRRSRAEEEMQEATKVYCLNLPVVQWQMLMIIQNRNGNGTVTFDERSWFCLQAKTIDY